MRFRYMTITIQDHFYLAWNLVAGLVLLLVFGYLFIYKKFLKGEEKINTQKIVVWFGFIGYLVMVMGVTFLNRSSGTWGSERYGSVNLHFLSSYREAWNSFSFTSWKFIILNILLLLPLGMFLPLLNERFQKLKWIFSVTFVITLSIETFQLITGRGRFMLDDLFNNITGAIIGYGIIMVILTNLQNQEGKLKKTIIYLTPLILVVVSSVIIISLYQLKEYGNLPITHNYQKDMNKINLSLNAEVEHKIQKKYPKNNKYPTIKKPIYKIPIYDDEKGENIFKDILYDQNILDEEIEVERHKDKVIYSIKRKPTHHMVFSYKGGTYIYNNPSYFLEAVDKNDADKENRLSELEAFNIIKLESTLFNKMNDGNDESLYNKRIDNYVEGDYITNGNIVVLYHNNQKIKNIINNIIKYKKIEDVPIISKKEAYENLKAGKFNIYSLDNIQKIEVENITLSYMLDSKGFYQPIYNFQSIINGEHGNISIPAR